MKKIKRERDREGRNVKEKTKECKIERNGTKREKNKKEKKGVKIPPNLEDWCRNERNREWETNCEKKRRMLRKKAEWERNRKAKRERKRNDWMKEIETFVLSMSDGLHDSDNLKSYSMTSKKITFHQKFCSRTISLFPPWVSECLFAHSYMSFKCSQKWTWCKMKVIFHY